MSEYQHETDTKKMTAKEFAGYMQLQNGNGGIGGGVLGAQSPVSGIGQYISSSELTIPLRATEWRKLSRETQIKVLDEIGILNP